MELMIQHERNHGQRMIEIALDMSEHRRNALQDKTAGNLCVFIHVKTVVEVDKFILHRLAEDRPHNSRKENTDAKYSPPVIQTSRTAFGFQRAEICHSRHFTGRQNECARRHGSGFFRPCFFLRSSTHGVEHMIKKIRKPERPDRKSTRLNSSHANISYAVF